LIIFFSSSLLYSQEIIIPLETQNTALVFKVNENQYLKILYFGKKLQEDTEYGCIQSVKYIFSYLLISSSLRTKKKWISKPLCLG